MQIELSLTFVECAVCFVPFGITERFHNKRREDGEIFYCPSGHHNLFKESEIAKLKKALSAAQTREQLERDQRHAAEQKAEAEAKARVALQNRKDKMEKRIKNGVCPCCKRSFCNLQRHISTKHPEFSK